MIAACDSGPLIWLSRVDRFSILPKLFTEILIPPAVHFETVVNASGYSNAHDVQAAIEAGWMKVQAPTHVLEIPSLSARLHAGEAETIALAAEQQTDAVLLDDRRAREYATEQGLRIIGTVGLLLMARERGGEPNLKGILDQMRDQGFRLSENLYRQICSQIQ